MLDRVLYNWNFFRIVRIAIGIFLLIDGIYSKMWLLVAIGIFFTLLPLFNIGCSLGSCARKIDKSSSADEDEVIYEEVTVKKD